ncbi:hypothetical protein ACRQ5Q_42415 (plasmid) [Bradyrhizobium sp. PMVTL-01]|uniref:hypothetical protein n=1 Tax=Bradyrhizobium sp. PMVTL-01 TaxID=3434999 RepID=UPI003F722981
MSISNRIFEPGPLLLCTNVPCFSKVARISPKVSAGRRRELAFGVEQSGACRWSAATGKAMLLSLDVGDFSRKIRPNTHSPKPVCYEGVQTKTGRD